MKKIIALALALMMILSLSVTAFADQELGSITINGASTENTYSIYRMLDLESYDVSSGAYSYKVNSAWSGFFATDAAKAYMTIGEGGYVSWVAAEDDDTKATFAKLALAYAQSNGIPVVKTTANEGDAVFTGTALKFSNLPLGYYLVDSTMGALCGLTTTNPDASINAKNGIPTIDKQVLEDSTNQWGATATMDIAQTVYYRITINVHAGAQNYVLHDNMGDGLTFEKVTKIEHIVPGTTSTTTELTAKDSEATTYDYEVKDPSKDTCDFEIHFTKEFCDELETNDKIVVYYQAMLNRNAVIAGDGNINIAHLTFGEGGAHKSNEDSTTVYTYAIDIVKTDSQNKLIDGAEFRIYNAETEGQEIKVVKTDDKTAYRLARPTEPAESIVVTNGMIRVNGLDNGTYYLEETEAPDGYNKLTARQKFIISDGNLEATFNDTVYSTGSGVHVVNKTGSMLPETGGIGTTLFVTIGAMVAMAAGVLLVTKKRMSMIED